MKGPIFIKENGEFKLAECCFDCGFCSAEREDCILPDCLFISVVPNEDEESE